jgi:hypothetical protein
MRCFVISPIGQPGSAARDHADDVFHCIIEPALKEADIRGHRADHVQDVGRITKKMYEDILTSDFCIAVLHGFNPNVFYELAIAHSAGIPVVLLSEEGVDLPFDLKDERVFHYDLSPRAIYRGENVRALLAMIESVRRLEGLRIVPFGNNLVPLNGAANELPYSLAKETNASAEFWIGLIKRSRARLSLAGIGFTSWKGIPGMREALIEASTSGCEIRVLTMDSTNPAFQNMLNPEISSPIPASRGSINEEARAWFQATLVASDKCAVKALKKGMLFQQLIIYDNAALISPYLYSATTGYSPRLDINDKCPAFDVFVREYEELWAIN